MMWPAPAFATVLFSLDGTCVLDVGISLAAVAASGNGVTLWPCVPCTKEATLLCGFEPSVMRETSL